MEHSDDGPKGVFFILKCEKTRNSRGVIIKAIVDYYHELDVLVLLTSELCITEQLRGIER